MWVSGTWGELSWGEMPRGKMSWGDLPMGIVRRIKYLRCFLYLVAELQEQYGDVIGVYLGNKPTIWLHDPLKGKIRLLTKPHNNLAQSYILL
jgi:hypothetical protein